MGCGCGGSQQANPQVLQQQQAVAHEDRNVQRQAPPPPGGPGEPGYVWNGPPTPPAAEDQ